MWLMTLGRSLVSGPDVVNDTRSVALLVGLMWLMTLGRFSC